MTTDCCSEPKRGMLSVEEARGRILELVKPIGDHEQLALRQALGRTLAEEIHSSFDVPPYDNSAMDGYALHSRDLPGEGRATLQVVGTVLAGHPFDGMIGGGEAVRIMTGAKLPESLDTIIMQEQVERCDDQITIGSGHQQGDHVRRAGEDIRKGDTVLSSGTLLRPAELGLLASLGIGAVRVGRRVRVAFFSTGDELREAGESLAEGQIYDSNRYTLYGLLKRLDVEMNDMGIIPDRPEAIENAFTRAAEWADLVITSGGVSVGDADYVKQTLDRLGRIDFWKIAMKPGKPLAYGTLGSSLFFGLPGNPVSAMATFYQFVIPALRKMKGEPQRDIWSLRVPTDSDLKKAPGRTDFQRGILHSGSDGTLTVTTTGLQGSHVLSSMSRANCFIVLPAESGDVAAGSLVEVQPFDALL